MALIIAILLSVISLLFPKSKFVTIIFFLFMWLLWGWNYENGDYSTYSTIYSKISSGANLPIDEGFAILIRISDSFGLNFASFQIVFSLISLIVLYIAVSWLTKFTNIVSIIYFWVYFPLDYVLMRNTLAFALILMGIACVFKQIRHANLFFIAFSLLAVSLHASTVFYLSFLSVFLYKKSNPSILLFFVCMIVIAFYIFLSSIAGLFADSFEGKADYYQGSIGIFLIYTICQIFSYMLISKCEITARRNAIMQQQFTELRGMNILLFIITPVYLFLGVIVRIFRNTSFLNSIMIVNLIYTKKKPTWLIIPFLLYLTFFYVHFIIPVADDTIISLFNFNLIFNLL